eukprot:7166855-Prymnesium_polylepis.1
MCSSEALSGACSAEAAALERYALTSACTASDGSSTASSAAQASSALPLERATSRTLRTPWMLGAAVLMRTAFASSRR